MKDYLAYGAAFGFGVAATALLVPVVGRLAVRLRAVARPGPRSVHEKPAPLWGGLALFLPWALAIIAALAWGGLSSGDGSPSTLRILALLYGAAILVAFGLIDDRWGIPAGVKLFGQVLAIVVLLRAGYAIGSFAVPFAGTLNFGVLGPLVFGLWVLAITNAFNLIDGMDGLAAGVAFFAASTSAVLAIASGNAFVAISSLCLAGSLLAFLRFNFPPARIFLGDTGSLFIGFLLACLVTQEPAQKGTVVLTIFTPILPIAFAIADVLFAVARRFIRGKPIFAPDRRHIHHRLLERFHRPRRVLAILYGFCAITAAGTILVHFNRSDGAVLFLLGFLLILAVGFGKLIDLFRIREVVSAFRHHPHFQAIHAFLRFARARLRTVRTAEEALRILELGAECLDLQTLRVLEDGGHVLLDWHGNGATPSGGAGRIRRVELNSGHWLAEWSASDSDDAVLASEIEIVWSKLLEAASGALTHLETPSR